MKCHALYVKDGIAVLLPRYKYLVDASKGEISECVDHLTSPCL